MQERTQSHASKSFNSISDDCILECDHMDTILLVVILSSNPKPYTFIRDTALEAAVTCSKFKDAQCDLYEIDLKNLTINRKPLPAIPRSEL